MAGGAKRRVGHASQKATIKPRFSGQSRERRVGQRHRNGARRQCQSGDEIGTKPLLLILRRPAKDWQRETQFLAEVLSVLWGGGPRSGCGRWKRFPQIL